LNLLGKDVVIYVANKRQSGKSGKTSVNAA
jgi:hypothetical protein